MRLKNLVLGAALLALMATQVSAQNVHMGLEGGANFAVAMGPDASSFTNSRLGFVGGAFVCFQLGPNMAIQPEILYQQKGGEGSGGDGVKLDYIEIPLLFKTSLGTPGINPGIFVGPAVSLNVLAQQVTGGNPTDISNLNAADFGIVGGVEINIDKFFISGRYELGLLNITNVDNVQNGTITLLTGYSFL